MRGDRTQRAVGRPNLVEDIDSSKGSRVDEGEKEEEDGEAEAHTPAARQLPNCRVSQHRLAIGLKGKHSPRRCSQKGIANLGMGERKEAGEGELKQRRR